MVFVSALSATVAGNSEADFGRTRARQARVLSIGQRARSAGANANTLPEWIGHCHALHKQTLLWFCSHFLSQTIQIDDSAISALCRGAGRSRIDGFAMSGSETAFELLLW